MTQTTLNVRMDAELKQQFDAICSEFGMTPSTAVNIFARTIVRERRIPFEIAAPRDPFCKGLVRMISNHPWIPIQKGGNKLYNTKAPITRADILTVRTLPFFAA